MNKKRPGLVHLKNYSNDFIWTMDSCAKSNDVQSGITNAVGA